MDHTSIIQFFAEGLPPFDPGYSDSVNKRRDHNQGITIVLGGLNPMPRTAISHVPSIEIPKEALVGNRVTQKNTPTKCTRECYQESY